MLDGLFIASLVGTLAQAVKEARQPTIPAENWANKKLYHKDLMSKMSGEQLMKNVQNGKYKLVKNYTEPHRDPVSGKIIIENCKLYREDVKNYGAYQAQEWVKQGKYNLNPEELEKEHERLREHYERVYKML